MGEVVQLPRRRVVRKRVRSGVKFDANRLLLKHEQAKKFVADLATSPLMQDVQRTLPVYVAAGEACS
jgi:energy-coupling factor transporter ATP-binding protein EcfA2